MDELKNKLGINNSTIQIQTVRRLFDLVVSQKKTDEPLTPDAPQPPELGLLLERCGADNELLAVSCSEALVRLVLLGHVQHGLIQKGLLNAVPTAKSVVGIAGALSDLMVAELIASTEGSSDTYVSPYGIRSRPHPFISLATARADSWPVLLRQVQRLLRWPHHSVQQNAVILLRPFLQFVLLEPAASQQFLQLRLCVPRLLLTSAKVKDTQLKVIEFLEDAVSCLQVKTAAQVGEAWAFLDQLSCVLLEGSSRSKATYLVIRGQVAGHCLGLAGEAGRLGVDSEGFIETAARLLKGDIAPGCLPRVWLMTGQLLLTASDRHTSHLLHIVRLCLGREEALPRPLLASMVLPLLHVTSAPPRVGTEKRAGPARAARLLQDLSELLTKDETKTTSQPPSSFCITPEGATLEVYSCLASQWVALPASCVSWLEQLGAGLSSSSRVPDHLVRLVAGVCVWSSDRTTLQAALQVLAKIAAVAPEQAADFLPLFMFCLGYHDDPTLRLVFLEAMPKAATHKVSVAPTLKMLQLLGETQALRPVALRLVTALWKRQDRCFPYLQRMLQAAQHGTSSLEEGVDEVLLAKAACIKEICEERPHQHGADMLAPLSAILNECTRDQEAVPACFALEGLVALCEAEVVDIRTVWAVLAPKLNKDTRPQVARRICELFSLVPSLSVNSDDYEDFKQQTLRSLWKRAQDPDGAVASAAYRALTSFSRNDLTLDTLPSVVTEDLCKDEETQSTEPQPTPGICFVRLLDLIKDDVLPAYGDLLISLVSEEVRELPRGVYHSAITRRPARPGADKALSALPDLLSDRYDKVKQPGLRASLAAGLLFSFDPQPEAGKDGRVRRAALVAHGRNYHQKLYSLLHEVMLQPSDWHCCMSIPRAWVSFMDRCFHAYLESRRAELAASLDQGQVSDPEEHELLTQTAWLWCRDKLTDLIKSASRGGPSIQANCVLALAGLAVTATRYASGLDEVGTAAAKEATEHLGHAHWLSITVNTLLSVLDPSYQPTGRVFSMCQQHPGQSLSSATALARGAACLALPLLVPIILTVNTATIPQAIGGLTRQLPGQHTGSKRGEAGVAAPLFPGLGLGALLARLLDEQYADVAGTEGKEVLWKAIKILETTSSSENTHRQGCLLGLAMCIPSLCKDGRTDTRTHIPILQASLKATMDGLDPKDIAYTGVTLCVSVLAVATYSTGHLQVDNVNGLVAEVHEAHCKDVNDGGLAVALGGMCHGLGVAGHPTIGELTSKLQTTWLSCIQQEDLSTLQRLCVLHGLLSLAGADANLFSALEETGAESGPVTVQEVVRAVTRTDPGDLGLQSAANWRLGQLYMEVGTKTSSNAAVPSTYQYLPESSVLRPVVDRLLQAGKQGDLQGPQVLPLLSCLVEGPSSRPLPPLNWTTLLSPILRLALGEQVTRLCLQLAIRQAASAPTASLLLASYMVSPLWNNIDEKCKTVIFDNLGSIIKTISAPKLREFLTKSVLGEFGSCSPTLRTAACKGLQAALQVPDPPQAVTLALHQALEQLYNMVPNEDGLFGIVAGCLREVPDNLVDSITKDDFTDGISFVKASFTRCYLVSQGTQPLAWLNPAIEMALWENESALLYNSEPKGVLLELVVHCFYQYKTSQSDTTSTAKLSQWLLELMGHVRSIANGNVVPPEGSEVSGKTVEFGLLVWSAVVVMMSGSGCCLVIPTVPMASYRPPDTPSPHLTQLLTTLLPQALLQLLEADQWKKMNGKIIDWLISMYALPTMTELPHWQASIKGCLRALRHTVEFRKMATWSQAYML